MIATQTLQKMDRTGEGTEELKSKPAAGGTGDAPEECRETANTTFLHSPGRHVAST